MNVTILRSIVIVSILVLSFFNSAIAAGISNGTVKSNAPHDASSVQPIKEVHDVIVNGATFKVLSNNSNTQSFSANANGVVRDFNNEYPVPEVSVTFTDAEFSKTMVSDRDGRFLIEEIPAGNYDVSISKKGYKLYSARIMLEDGHINDVHIVASKIADFKKMAFFVLGGLGIFLLGMRFLSDGLQAVSGPTLKRMIALVTDNRFLATCIGALVTMFVQSSSITTVMAVGFVNSGVMALNQAIGVILGANIGTTITGWIMVLKIGKWGLPIIGVFVFIYLFSKKERLKYIALACMGLGMVFFGLELMKDGFKPIKHMPEFIAWFTMVDASSYINVVKLAAIGCALTMVVQSSSATLVITIGLAATGVINFETSAALVLGVNIGTTITALLASIGVSTNARRVAYFHCIFNVVGAVWVIATFKWYVPFIVDIIGTNPDTMVLVDGVETYPYIVAAIAMTHTVFNIVNTVIFLPFTGYIGDFLMKLVKDKKQTPKDLITNLQYSMLSSPYASIQQSKIEIDKMEVQAKEMMDDLKQIFLGSDKKDILIKKVFKDEDNLDLMQKEITEFLTEFLSTAIPHDVAEMAKDHLRMCDELESVSDYVMQILKLKLRLEDNDTRLSDVQIQNIISLHDTVKDFFNCVMQFETRDAVRDNLKLINGKSEAITQQVRLLRNDYWKTAAEEKVNPMVSTSYTDILQSYRKIKNHLLNEVEVQAL